LGVVLTLAQGLSMQEWRCCCTCIMWLQDFGGPFFILMNPLPLIQAQFQNGDYLSKSPQELDPCHL
jgi:hypothetical protein